MGREVAVGVVIGTAIAACFSAPPRPSGTDDAAVDDAGTKEDGGSGTGTGSGVDAADGCAVYTFATAGSDCGSWASLPVADPGWMVRRTSGRLELVSASGSGAGYAACRESATGALVSAEIHVEQPFGASPDHEMSVGLDAGDGFFGVQIGYGSGYEITATCTGVVTDAARAWQPTQERVIRFALTGTTLTMLLGEPGGPLGVFATCSAPELASVSLQVSIKRGSGGSTATAALDNLTICR